MRSFSILIGNLASPSASVVVAFELLVAALAAALFTALVDRFTGAVPPSASLWFGSDGSSTATRGTLASSPMSDDLDRSSRTERHDVEHLRLRIETEDGVDLEAELAGPAPVDDRPPAGAMVVCHPHPLYGGSMHANVVEALFRSLPSLGVGVVRFNFRGAGSSTGTHDGGGAERLDAAAAVGAAATRWPDAPLTLAGYSFGADVSLAVDDPAISGWFAVAPPLGIVDRDEMPALTDQRPKTMVAAENDQFNPHAKLAETVAAVPNTTVVSIPGADHFFAVGLEDVVAAARSALGV